MLRRPILHLLDARLSQIGIWTKSNKLTDLHLNSTKSLSWHVGLKLEHDRQMAGCQLLKYDLQNTTAYLRLFEVPNDPILFIVHYRALVE